VIKVIRPTASLAIPTMHKRAGRPVGGCVGRHPWHRTGPWHQRSSAGEQLSGAFCSNAPRSLDRILNQGRVSLLFADAHGAMRHLPNLSVGRERAAALVGERKKLSVWLRHIDGRPFPAVEQHSFRSGLARRFVDFGQRSSAGARQARRSVDRLRLSTASI